jgi:hypothetical protein
MLTLWFKHISAIFCGAGIGVIAFSWQFSSLWSFLMTEEPDYLDRTLNTPLYGAYFGGVVGLSVSLTWQKEMKKAALLKIWSGLSIPAFIAALIIVGLWESWRDGYQLYLSFNAFMPMYGNALLWSVGLFIWGLHQQHSCKTSERKIEW